MKKLFIIKIGTTFPDIAEHYGDFDTWTLRTLGPADAEISVIDAEHGEPLPRAKYCAGVIISGSHSMVTDNLPWSTKIEDWIPSLLDKKVPFFGICYGHQVLAQATGGEVGDHPLGKEIGTVKIQLLPEYADDDLLSSLPQHFLAHTSHKQAILRLPPGAIRLASSSHEPNHIFRIGSCAWGVQFHPEYNCRIMRSYIRKQAKDLESEGYNVSELIGGVRETPFASHILKNFSRIVSKQLA
ncbi:MAG: glutamine amidotransferase [Deltaproteobacteria bacterium]|nr:glutamine amidotransferase [Deltaproteobacteria bacterium]